jgi:hypothetical protein
MPNIGRISSPASCSRYSIPANWPRRRPRRARPISMTGVRHARNMNTVAPVRGRAIVSADTFISGRGVLPASGVVSCISLEPNIPSSHTSPSSGDGPGEHFVRTQERYDLMSMGRWCTHVSDRRDIRGVNDARQDACMRVRVKGWL